MGHSPRGRRAGHDGAHEHTNTRLSIHLHEDLSFVCMSSFYDFSPISVTSSKHMNSSS